MMENQFWILIIFLLDISAKYLYNPAQHLNIVNSSSKQPHMNILFLLVLILISLLVLILIIGIMNPLPVWAFWKTRIK